MSYISGYTGTTCNTVTSPCEPENPCLNSGTCYEMGESVGCSCPVGYYGDYCEKSEATCNDTVCKNGGTCRQGGIDVLCECTNLYTGLHCEKSRSSFTLYLYVIVYPNGVWESIIKQALILTVGIAFASRLHLTSHHRHIRH